MILLTRDYKHMISREEKKLSFLVPSEFIITTEKRPEGTRLLIKPNPEIVGVETEEFFTG